MLFKAIQHEYLAASNAVPGELSTIGKKKHPSANPRAFSSEHGYKNRLNYLSILLTLMNLITSVLSMLFQQQLSKVLGSDAFGRAVHDPGLGAIPALK